MKNNIIVSCVAGILFGVPFGLITLFFVPEYALKIGTCSGLLFAVSLSACLYIHSIWLDWRYAQAEKAINAQVICKANCNFSQEGKVKSGRVYFCREGVIFISLDGKPYTMDVIPAHHVAGVAYDMTRLTVNTTAGEILHLMVPDLPQIIETLKDAGILE